MHGQNVEPLPSAQAERITCGQGEIAAGAQHIGQDRNPLTQWRGHVRAGQKIVCPPDESIGDVEYSVRPRNLDLSESRSRPRSQAAKPAHRSEEHTSELQSRL